MKPWAYIWQWLRPYQRDIVLDASRYIVINKSRRIGISDASGLKAVLIASGIYQEVLCHAFDVDPIVPHNVNVVSKDELAAKEVIKYAKKWVHALRRVPELRGYLENGSEWSKSAIDFAHTGFEIRAHTQSENAARSATGHLVLDEAAHYAEYEGIERGAVPSIDSMPGLTLTRVSTPNGTTGRGELFYRICEFPDEWPQYSRHRITIFDAVEQGMPVNVEEIRARAPSEDIFQQEYNCSFLGAGQNYFAASLLKRATEPRVGNVEAVYMGIDVASVVDLTAVSVWRVVDNRPWLCERYLISGVPYASAPGIIGQDKVLGALIRHHRPARTCIDATGDTSTIMTGLHSASLPTQIVARHVKREWKEKTVPAFKGAFERGQVLIDANAATYQYDKTRASRAGAVDVETCFGQMRRDPLVRDFERVHKRLTPGGATTYDTTRDGDGHGDLFWSSILGWTMALGGTRRIADGAVHHLGGLSQDLGGW